jgi:hypothetical protein
MAHSIRVFIAGVAVLSAVVTAARAAEPKPAASNGAAQSAAAAESAPAELAKKVVDAAGGADKLLKLFRIKEDLYLGSSTKPMVRNSVVEPPAHWYMSGRDRVVQDKEPAIDLVWGWSLAILVEPKSKLAAAPAATINDRPAVGLVVTESVKNPMTLYFDAETHRLVRIDQRGHQTLFSDYRQVDGVWYAAKSKGINPSGKEWYHTEITSVERLAELPAELKK